MKFLLPRVLKNILQVSAAMSEIFFNMRREISYLQVACEQAPGVLSPNEAREPVDILLMPPFYDTSYWYHDMIG